MRSSQPSMGGYQRAPSHNGPKSRSLFSAVFRARGAAIGTIAFLLYHRRAKNASAFAQECAGKRPCRALFERICAPCIFAQGGAAAFYRKRL